MKKPNVSSYALPALSSSSLSTSLSASTSLPTTKTKTNRTYKFGESTSACRSSTSSSLKSSSGSQATESECSECSECSTASKRVDMLECQSLLNSQTDSVDSTRTFSVNRLRENLSNHNSPHALPSNLSSNLSSSSRTYTKSESKSESLSESTRDASEILAQNASESRSGSYSRSKTDSVSDSQSETISQSSTRRLLDASNSLYTTADDCSCRSSLTLTCDANDVIPCSKSSCLISACCSTNINFINRLKEQHDRLVELDETECYDNCNLDDEDSSANSLEEDSEEDDGKLEEEPEDRSSSGSSQGNSKTQSGEVNQVKSEDQSTYNQSHTYTLSEEDEEEDGLQEGRRYDRLNSKLNRLNLTSLNALITRTNQASHFNRSNPTNNPTNNCELQTNQMQLTNRINKKQSAANPADTISNGYERLSQRSDLKESGGGSDAPSSRQRTDSGDPLDDRTTISETNSSALNDEDTSSLSQLTKSNDDSLGSSPTVPTQQPSGTLIKPLDSSTFNQLTDKQLIEMEEDGGSRQKNSDRLVTMNLDETDEPFSDEERLLKGNRAQLHLNTMSDISMLTFPEVDGTFKQGTSSKCLLDCGESSKNHHELLDETNTYNDLRLLKEFDDLNTSTAQVRFDEDNQLYKYTDPTIHSGDHSSELDSDLDAEFDREEDELVLLQQAAEQVDDEELPTDICDYNLQENRPTEASHCRIIDLKRLAQDDNIIFSKANLENFVSSKYSL